MKNERFPGNACFAAACIGALLVVAFVVLVTGVFDISARTYAGRDEARKDRAFERGWLPAFIPPSARNISLEHNSDVCVTNGRFQFSADDLRAFVDAIQAADDGDRRHGVAMVEGQKLAREGYYSYQYNRGDTCCTFMIHPVQGRCEFAAGGLFRGK